MSAPPLARLDPGVPRGARARALPGSVCALVGEGSAVSRPCSRRSGRCSRPRRRRRRSTTSPRGGEGGRIHLEADIGEGTIFLDARPPDTLNLNRAGAPPVLFLPANLRKRTLVAPATGSGAAEVAELLQPPAVDHHWAAADGGLALVAGMERLLASNLRHFVLLIEEPELYLSPHAQRHLYSVLRRSRSGEPDPLLDARAVFLSVDKLEELALVRHTPTAARRSTSRTSRRGGELPRALGVRQRPRRALPRALPRPRRGPDREATFPLVFDALGVDPDKEGILVLECGGKGNMPLFARICNACGVPYVVVHDRDAPRGERPVESERVVNRQIREVAGQPADGRPHAGLRDGLRLQAERPRPQAPEGVAAVPGQRRDSARAARRGREGPRGGAELGTRPPRARARRRTPCAPRARACRAAARALSARRPVRWASAWASSQSASHGLRGSSGPWRYVPITRPARQPS